MTREARVKSSPTVQLKKAAVCLDSANRDSLSSPVMAEGRGEKKRGHIVFRLRLTNSSTLPALPSLLAFSDRFLNSFSHVPYSGASSCGMTCLKMRENSTENSINILQRRQSKTHIDGCISLVMLHLHIYAKSVFFIFESLI